MSRSLVIVLLVAVLVLVVAVLLSRVDTTVPPTEVTKPVLNEALVR
jgi:hypothetical protein